MGSYPVAVCYNAKQDNTTQYKAIQCLVCQEACAIHCV